MILAADNIQITNRVIEYALAKMDSRPIQDMAIKCEELGANALDINTGPLTRDPEEKMKFFVETVQEVSDLPILLDTVNTSAIRAGLMANKKTAIINGFSLEPAKLCSILLLANEFNVEIIGYLLNPKGHVPLDSAERLSIALEIFELAEKAGVDRSKLILDPVLVPLMWQDGTYQAREVLSVIRKLPELLDFPVKTIVGLSNLTSGKSDIKRKSMIEQAYLPMLADAGVSMVLLNVFHKETVNIARVCNALTDNKIFSWETL